MIVDFQVYMASLAICMTTFVIPALLEEGLDTLHLDQGILLAPKLANEKPIVPSKKTM
jgi:hypothetical protein